MNLLNEAITLATMAHDGQVDKAGNPYIFHPLRVMMKVQKYGEAAMVVGVLHDAIEDTDLKLSELVGHYPDRVIEAIDAITHRKNESREDYYEHVKGFRLAYWVKLADIEDNMNRLWQLEDPETRDRLYRKYQKALEILT